ncbi:hypothetical protein Q4489_03185 [Thalassotalea sp. 1_MG-2023]|uniref:hypothetical protein n=1 Tax=Thalassotalea sp. 1_MG-2023 TaxID=3062680 RepID=UPI0026E35D88|nr:hypothetical protein [Thalassotalea sp. 1_MG-2023]MDO6425997.1 hypothetical protein [Thalassotalea sp. 1_MG-2023]
MKNMTKHKQYIIGPLIALLALLCGSASAKSVQQITHSDLKKMAKQDIQLVMEQNKHLLNLSTKTVTLKPINTLTK